MRKTSWLVAFGLLCACAGLKDLAGAAFLNPKLSFRSASVETLDLEGATIAFRVDVENPNSFGVKLARISWAIEVEGARVAAGEMPGGLEIAARATSPVTFPVRLRFRDVPGIAALLAGGKDQVRYGLTGAIGIRTPLGIVDVPFSHEDSLRLPTLPQFAIDGLSVRSVTFSQIALDVRLRVRNPNGFALPAGRLDYALALGGTQVARAEGAPLSGVAGGASAVVEIPVRVDLASAGRAAGALVRGGDVDVSLSGKADLGGIPLPLDLKGTVPARR